MTDRETEIRIAERNGWRWWRSATTGKRALFPPEDDPIRGCRPEWFSQLADGTEPLVTQASAVPRYITDLDAAFRLVEQLADRVHLTLHSPFDIGLKWHAGFTPLGVTGWNGRPDHVAEADTPARAIALAALRYLEAEEKTE